MSGELYVVCPTCGNRYNLFFFERKEDIICPFCGQIINTVRRDTEVIVKVGNISKQELLSIQELENSSYLVGEVEKDLAKMEVKNLLEKFYALEELISRYLENTSEEEKLRIARAVVACKMQIELAPRVKEYFQKHNKGLPLPIHLGYATLSEIREREGFYEEAIKLCHQAYSEGWTGDWLERIYRCKKTDIYRREK